MDLRITELIDSLPALSAVNPALPGVIVLLFMVGMVFYRDRQNAGFMSGAEALMAVAVGALGARGATLAGGPWPEVVFYIGQAAFVAGGIALGLRTGRDRRGKRRDQPHPNST